MDPIRVLAFAGSLRHASYNKGLIRAAVSLAPTSMTLEIFDISGIPLYNQDVEDTGEPEAVVTFKQAIAGADALLVATPEYNHGVPGVLKNAIDVGSRPYGDSAWSGKPGAVISVSPGAIGAFGANHHLRQSLVFLDVPAMPQPEAYIGRAAKLFDASGALIDDSTRDLLKKFLDAFAQWIEKNIAK